MVKAELIESTPVQHETGIMNVDNVPDVDTAIEQWDAYMSDLANSAGTSGQVGTVGDTRSLVTDEAKPKYADEILPFDITISLANEYGNKAVTVIYGVEILNEGIGFSIDSPTSERAYTFVARSVDTMTPVDEEHMGIITTTW